MVLVCVLRRRRLWCNNNDDGDAIVFVCYDESNKAESIDISNSYMYKANAFVKRWWFWFVYGDDGDGGDDGSNDDDDDSMLIKCVKMPMTMLRSANYEKYKHNFYNWSISAQCISVERRWLMCRWRC